MPRTGWLLCNIPLSEVEDVAQHTFDVAAMTLLLAGELERGGKKFDVGRALSIAIVHDWAESGFGDFPYTALKYLGPTGTKKRIEKRILDEILGKLSNKEKYLKFWQEYSEKRTGEAKLVHAADYLSMLVQAVKYRERGNRSRELDELWRVVCDDIKPYTEEFPVVKELITELQKCYSGIP